MKVRLLKNIPQNGGIKCSRRRPLPDGSYAVEVPFVKDAIVEMSDASARKYVQKGLAIEWVEGSEENQA